MIEALAAAVTVAAILPVSVVVPIRTTKTSLPGEVAVVMVPEAVTRKVVPACIRFAGSEQATTCA